MPRRTMAERKRRTAERQTRRDTLAVLLSRMQRGALLDAERPLLRAHVEAELSDAEDLRRTVNGQQKVIQRLGAQLDAAHDAIREAEQAAADTAEQLRAYRAVEEQRQADRATRPCQAEQRPNYDYCPCNGMCHQCDDTPCDECQPPTTSTPEPQP